MQACANEFSEHSEIPVIVLGTSQLQTVLLVQEGMDFAAPSQLFSSFQACSMTLECCLAQCKR